MANYLSVFMTSSRAGVLKRNEGQNVNALVVHNTKIFCMYIKETLIKYRYR